MPRKIPDHLVAHAAELIRGGAKLKDAAVAIGCNPDELSKKVKALGVEVPGARKTIDWARYVPEILALYEGGYGTPAIAAKLGLPRHQAGGIRKILIKHGVMRPRSGAMFVRMAGMTPEERRENLAAGRGKRVRNLTTAALEAKAHRAIGIGELEIAKILEDDGLPVIRQALVDDNYLIDVAVGNVAVEVKSNSTSAHISKFTRPRFEKLAECGYAIVFVVCNHVPTILHHADDLIAVIEKAYRDPPSRGEYWVVRCCLDQIGTDLDVDHWSVEKRFPKGERTRF